MLFLNPSCLLIPNSLWFSVPLKHSLHLNCRTLDCPIAPPIVSEAPCFWFHLIFSIPTCGVTQGSDFRFFYICTHFMRDLIQLPNLSTIYTTRTTKSMSVIPPSFLNSRSYPNADSVTALGYLIGFLKITCPKAKCRIFSL